jgi:phosphoribosylanthranilate isomerase
MFVKVCGITRLEDAEVAVDAGASALGFIFWPRSPRYIEVARAARIIAALPASLTTVGVFVNASLDEIRDVVARSGLTTVQLHGEESPEFAEALGWPVLRATPLDAVAAEASRWPAQTIWLLDAFDPVARGGTGTRIDWNRAAVIARERSVVLAGGLTPDNVQEAVATVRPYGVDVSSGVEDAPGIKNAGKVRRFVAHAHSAVGVR